MSRPRDYKEAPIDTVGQRIIQARGVVSALLGAFDEKGQEHNLGAQALHEALWAVDELLRQADIAAYNLIQPSKPVRKGGTE
jgi:hypothetical protein